MLKIKKLIQRQHNQYPMKCRIVTDTAADLPTELLKKHNIVVVPHIVTFEEKDWKLGVDISIEDFYEKLNTLSIIPKSSTPTPQDFISAFEKTIKKEKFDHIIYVSVSEKLTATMAVARIASKEFENKITLIDSKSASGVQGMICLAIASFLEKGMSIEEIVKEVDYLIEEYILDVGFYTLENVYKSGRLKSKFILNLTKMIKIKPIAVMERPGKLVSTIPGFILGSHMERRLSNIVIKRAKKQIRYDMILSHVDNLEGSKRIANRIKKKVNINNVFYTKASPIVGSNTGKKTIIVSLVPSV